MYFIMMVGLPGSGKTTFANKLAKKINAKVFSSDDFRKKLYGSEGDQSHNKEVFALLKQELKMAMLENKNIIYDACNINYKKRKRFLEEIKNFDYKKICYLVATPYNDCIKQNQLRIRNVPEYAIKNMYMNFYIPQYYEGWDQIRIIDNFNFKNFELNDLFSGKNGLNEINQDNPHHELTIGQHCLKCATCLESLDNNISLELFQAALLHDIGKKFTKVFNNYKGEKTDIAHYYQHHLVSAYDSLFYDIQCDRILRSNYIQWHMQPFFIKTERAKNKFFNLVGEKDYNKIMLLHEADRMAH